VGAECERPMDSPHVGCKLQTTMAPTTAAARLDCSVSLVSQQLSCYGAGAVARTHARIGS